MTVPTSAELGRQYRLTKQTLAMHSYLRESYAQRVMILRCVLLAGSAIFCATAFAGDDVFAWIGVAPTTGRYGLRAASLLSFIVSLLLLLLGWDAAAARHGDAAKRFSELVGKFRKYFDDPSDASVPTVAELMEGYEKACHESVPIPNRLHPSLKARYLLTVEVTRLLDEAPGCPPFVLRWILRAKAIKRGIQRAVRNDFNTISKPAQSNLGGTASGSLSVGQGNGDSERVCG